MKLATRQKWVDALRSGQYKQGKGCLREDGRYCCLGVLAEIEGLLDADGAVDDNKALLPRDILPLFEQRILATMNDDGATFIELADKIPSLITCED